MYEPPSRFNITIPVVREGGWLPDPVSFAVAAERAARRRSASIVSAKLADQIISVVTVYAPARYAAVAVAQAIVSEAVNHQVPAPGQHTGDARGGAAAPRISAA